MVAVDPLKNVSCKNYKGNGTAHLLKNKHALLGQSRVFRPGRVKPVVNGDGRTQVSETSQLHIKIEMRIIELRS